MITGIANEYANSLVEKSKMHDQYASTAAVCYAESDEARYKAEFEHQRILAKLYMQFHMEFCNVAHGVERAMREQVEAKYKAEVSNG